MDEQSINQSSLSHIKGGREGREEKERVLVVRAYHVMSRD